MEKRTGEACPGDMRTKTEYLKAEEDLDEEVKLQGEIMRRWSTSSTWVLWSVLMEALQERWQRGYRQVGWVCEGSLGCCATRSSKLGSWGRCTQV